DEAQLKCHDRDVNHDGHQDLLCKFAVKDAGFTRFDEEAIVKGKTTDGRDVLGQGTIKLVRYHHGHREKRHHERRRHRDDD
ncbi:MAG: hypothetical protein P8Y24_08765, partial [Gammaproteobacteria bacterium]